MDRARVPVPRRRLSRLLLPALLAVAVTSGGLVLYYQQQMDVVRNYDTETRVTAEQVSYRLSAWLRDRVAIVGHMARYQTPGEDLQRFEMEAATFVEQVPGFQALNWVNPQGVISIVVPYEPNQGALGKSLTSHSLEQVRAAFAKALERQTPARTLSIPLFQGGTGISLYVPIKRPGGGVMNGVFRVDAIMNDALPDASLRQHYKLRLYDEDGQQIYAFGPEITASESVFEYPIAFVDRPLRLQIAGLLPPVAAQPVLFNWASLSLLAGLISGLMLHFFLDRQNQFRHQSRQIRLIMDSAVEGMLGLDLDGICVFCNAASAIRLGFDDANELVGRKLLHERLEHLHSGSEDSPEAIRVLGDVRQGLTRESRNAFLRRKDGTLFPIEYLATPIIERGEVSGAVFTFFDISGEVSETERLSRYQQVMDSVPELTALTDANGLIEVMNPAGRRMLKADAGEMLGRPFLDLFSPPSRDLIEASGLRLLRGPGVWQGEHDLAALDGSSVPVQLALLRLEDRFGAKYYALIARDLTEDRRMEAEQHSLRQQFQHAQKMESLGLLAGGIAHDFNNILVAVLGNASLAMQKLEAGSPEHSLVGAVETAAQRAADLTRQLLAYSGRGQFELAPMDIGQLVSEMADLLRASTPPSVKLTVSCEDAIPAAMVDATQIRQLVMNLITNGSDAIGEGNEGEVSIEVRSLAWEPSSAPPFVYGRRLPKGEYVAIRVEDSGPGMSPEIISHIFDPFFSTKPAGKGLGLSAVLGIVQGHKGMLCVDSTPETGTCFMLVLPPSTEVPFTAIGDSTQVSDERFGGTVLIIDDETIVREFAEAALSTLGFTVHSAADGREGLKMFRKLRDTLCLVLVDQSMPGMSGAETRMHMREIDDSVPAILMSGYDEQRVSSTLAEMGFGGFLKKPFRYGELRSLLHRVLKQAA